MFLSSSPACHPTPRPIICVHRTTPSAVRIPPLISHRHLLPFLPFSFPSLTFSLLLSSANETCPCFSIWQLMFDLPDSGCGENERENTIYCSFCHFCLSSQRASGFIYSLYRPPSSDFDPSGPHDQHHDWLPFLHLYFHNSLSAIKLCSTVAGFSLPKSYVLALTGRSFHLSSLFNLKSSSSHSRHLL